MGNHHNGTPLFTVEITEEGEDLGTSSCIESTGRFISEDDRRVVHERTGDRYALLLSTRKGGGQIGQFMTKTNRFKSGLCTATTLTSINTGVDQGQFNILQCVQARQQVEVLENKAQLTVTNTGLLETTQIAHILIIKDVATTRWSIEETDHGHQGTLTTP